MCRTGRIRCKSCCGGTGGHGGHRQPAIYVKEVGLTLPKSTETTSSTEPQSVAFRAAATRPRPQEPANLREHLLVSADAADARKAQIAEHRGKGEGRRYGTFETEQARYYTLSLTEEQNREVLRNAQIVGLTKADYVQRMILNRDVYGHGVELSNKMREEREVWLSIPEKKRAQLVSARMLAERGLGQVEERMKELEQLIILQQGSDDPEAYERVGDAMTEKKLLAEEAKTLRENEKLLKEKQAAHERYQDELHAARAAVTTAMLSAFVSLFPQRGEPKASQFSRTFINGLSAVKAVNAYRAVKA